MTKRLIIRTYQKDDTINIVKTRTSFQNQHNDAQRTGNPDRFRFIFESDDLDQCVFDASDLEVYERLENVHVLIAQTND